MPNETLRQYLEDLEESDQKVMVRERFTYRDMLEIMENEGVIGEVNESTYNTACVNKDTLSEILIALDDGGEVDLTNHFS